MITITLCVSKGIVGQVERSKNPDSQKQISCRVVEGEIPEGAKGTVTIPEVGTFYAGDANEGGFCIWRSHQTDTTAFEALFELCRENLGEKLETEAEFTPGAQKGTKKLADVMKSRR